MRALQSYRGVTIYTTLAGGFYAFAGAMVCRLTMGEVQGEIDRWIGFLQGSESTF